MTVDIYRREWLRKLLNDRMHRLHHVNFGRGYNEADGTEVAVPLDYANSTSSRLIDTCDPECNHHTVMLDIDMHCMVVRSTTPGHYHLYIDRVMTWPEYVELLDVMAKVGILEPGYVTAAKERGFTTLRFPWIKKEVAQVAPFGGEDDVVDA